MSIDRYLNTVHAACYRPFRKPKYVLLTCLLIWAGEKRGVEAWSDDPAMLFFSVDGVRVSV